MRVRVLVIAAVAAALTAQAEERPPDLEIRGKFRAREMRFEHVPNVNVRFSGSAGRHDVWTSSRRNFPKPVRPGETYRDVGGEVEISTKLPDGAPSAGARAPQPEKR